MTVKTAWSKFRTWGWAGVRGFLLGKCRAVVYRRRMARMAVRKPRFPRERGITVIADLTGQQALSKTMRDFLAMLRLAGIPYQTYDTRPRPAIPREDYEKILTPRDEFDFHRYTHIVELYRSILPDGIPEHNARVVFHDSEAGILDVMPYLDTTDSIIGMSDFNVDYFRAALPRSKIFKIVYPLMLPDRERTPRDEVRRKYGIGQDDFVVLFNFDFGSYYRKNPAAAIRAFAKAFPDAPNAKLLFKTKGAAECPHHVRELENLAAELGVADRFVHLSSYLPRRDVDGLTGACDVYLSLHKSEGFGIGMAEAMSQGKPVVATNWSANTEFCKPDTSWCIPYRMVPILSHEYPVEMKEWAEADVDAAAAALLEIKRNPKSAAERAARGAAFIREHFSIENFKRSVETFLNNEGDVL